MHRMPVGNLRALTRQPARKLPSRGPPRSRGAGSKSKLPGARRLRVVSAACLLAWRASARYEVQLLNRRASVRTSEGTTANDNRRPVTCNLTGSTHTVDLILSTPETTHRLPDIRSSIRVSALALSRPGGAALPLSVRGPRMLAAGPGNKSEVAWPRARGAPRPSTSIVDAFIDLSTTCGVVH